MTESIFPNPGTVSPRVTFLIPLGPSNTTRSPLISSTVHPSIVVGLVSGAGTALVDIFVRSADGCPEGGIFCSVSNEAECVRRASFFAISCAWRVALATATRSSAGIAAEARSVARADTSSRSDFTGPVELIVAMTCLTGMEADFVCSGELTAGMPCLGGSEAEPPRNQSEFDAPSHKAPPQANSNTPEMIMMRHFSVSREGAIKMASWSDCPP